MRTVIIGLGNPVRTDDGVGLRVAALLRDRLAGRPDVAVVELMAGGLRLVEAMSGFDRAVVVDATWTGRLPPGAVRRLGLADLGSCRSVACVHDTTLPAALELWRRAGEPLPASIEVIGIEAADIASFSEELTAEVGAALPAAVAAVLALCESVAEGEAR